MSIPAWISNHLSSKVWDQITYTFPNLNSATVEVWKWISNFIPNFVMDVITHSCWDKSSCSGSKITKLWCFLVWCHLNTNAKYVFCRKLFYNHVLFATCKSLIALNIDVALGYKYHLALNPFGCLHRIISFAFSSPDLMPHSLRFWPMKCWKIMYVQLK